MKEVPAIEVPVQFGSHAHLLGMLTRPPAAPPHAVGVILLNAGVIHRIGPHRLNVKLARELAARGFASLRFDLSGLGDSRVPPNAAGFTEQAVRDIRAAMDELGRRCGTTHFAIAGLCSGAHHGLNAALADERIEGLVLLDGHAYPTHRTRLVRMRRRLAQMSWAELLGWPLRRAARLVQNRREARAARQAAGEERSSSASTPTRRQYAAAMQTLVSRGVAVYHIYSGSLLESYNHASQFRDAFARFAFVDQVRCDYLSEIDHTVTPLAAQALVRERIAAWALALPRVAGARTEPDAPDSPALMPAERAAA
ncbi:alpha/beta hydrolase [Aquabacterium sp. A7-Y]|uniref:alpha/beta fold hydrolase n=1 Tax=Aquabacterium sp. A7-Y TaxID=1349605 RepID=UPI00223CBCCC|nr:alpha/beta fold hydrolase [Aquabacterium sp. A7-Y]MCW7537504.1 alpha/beta hydrolase [Aquabacterium sp. A7-Y]